MIKGVLNSISGLLIFLLLVFFNSCIAQKNDKRIVNSKNVWCRISILDSLTNEFVNESVFHTSTGKSVELNLKKDTRDNLIEIPCDSVIKIQVSSLGYRKITKAIVISCDKDTVDLIYHIKQVIKENRIYDVFPDSLNPNKK